MTTVWINPSATSYACLCEPCLERARTAGMLFADALMLASVRGVLPLEAAGAVVHCLAGHELVLRRVEKPLALVHHDDKQLQLT